MSSDLLKVVEESREAGRVNGALNLTFVALIPKQPKQPNPYSFSEYRPISLCNFAYKVISKIIAGRMKQ